MAVGDIAQVRVVGTWQGQQVVATWHFYFKSGVATLAALLSQLEASTTTFRDMMIGSLSSNLSWNELQGTMLIPYGAATQIIAISPTWTGSDVSMPGPAQTAIVVSKRTAFIGRARRGRMYLPGVCFNIQQGGSSLTAAFLATKQGQVNAFGAEYGQGGINADYEANVWSRTLAGPTPPFNPNGAAPLNTAVVRTILRTQRRRQLGVGA